MTEHLTEAESIAALAKGVLPIPVDKNSDDPLVIALPPGFSPKRLDYAVRPHRHQGATVYTFATDFIAEGMRLIKLGVTPEGNEPALVAQLHEDGQPNVGLIFNSDGARPGHKDHLQRFVPQSTTMHERIRGVINRPLEQDALAEFFEICRDCIAHPDAATLVEAARSLSISKRVEFNRKVVAASGSKVLSYKDENEMVGQVTLPNSISMRWAPWRDLAGMQHMDAMDLTAEVRLRFRDNQPRFVLHAPDFDDALEACTVGMLNRIAAELELPMRRVRK